MDSTQNWLFASILLLAVQVKSAENDELFVETSSGPIKGIRLMSESGKPVTAYLGIRYGKPPLDKRRFQHPEPADSWEEVFEASTKPVACYQNILFEAPGPSKVMSEDCLKLNIWVPFPRPKKAAVMIWIHGGGFDSGSSSLDQFDMKILSSEENIIGVSINYRLSSFGFLYLENPNIPGNAGLYDQALALQWIQANIAKFGGNEHQITLFGPSAGAVSVGFHLLSPISRKFFSRAIMQGGSPNAVFAIHNHSYAVNRALKLAKSIGCSNLDNIDLTVECLQEADPKVLIINETGRNSRLLSYAPVVDGALVKETPTTLLENGEFQKADLLIGTCKDEGSVFIATAIPGFSPFKEVYLTRSMFLRTIRYVNSEQSPLSQEAIDFEYTDWSDPHNLKKNTEAIGAIFGDTFITCPSTDFALSFMKRGNEVYQYELRRRPSNSTSPKWMGVVHSNENFFIFGKPLDTSGTFPAEEVVFTQRIMRYWANFARTGNPNISPSGEKESIEWPKHTFKREFLPLKDQRDKPDYGLKVRKCEFWSKYLPSLLGRTENKETFEEVKSRSEKSYLKYNSGVICLILYFIIRLQNKLFS